jgi:protein involved in polysaccharide export with SLBB domain
MDALLRRCFRFALIAVLLGVASGCASLTQRLDRLRGRPAAPQPQLSASTVAPGGAGKPAAVTAPSPVRNSATTPVVAPPPVATPVPQGPNDGVRAPYRLRPSDPVLIYLRGILPRDDQIEEIVDERGYVTLPFIDDVMAMGRTVSELEREIQRTYIERQIYKSITVNVVMPSQTFFVQGEVRQPMRFQLVTGMTILQAIATAGGYTEFAEPKRVMLTRNGKVRELNMRDIERNPQNDIPIESGDVIRVPRSIF